MGNQHRRIMTRSTQRRVQAKGGSSRASSNVMRAQVENPHRVYPPLKSRANRGSIEAAPQISEAEVAGKSHDVAWSSEEAV